jgi:hypothetical protein
MRSTYLIGGTIVLALVAAGVLFGTDFFRRNPFHTPTAEEQLVTAMNDVASTGGFAATFSQADAKKWQLGAGLRLERFSMQDSDAVFARLSSSIALDKTSIEWPQLGLSTTLPLPFTKLTNGQDIEVGIVARASQTAPSDALSAIYATQQSGNSGWKSFPLTSRFQLFKFTYHVPQVTQGFHNPPIVVLQPDATGQGRSAEILGIYVRRAPAQP